MSYDCMELGVLHDIHEVITCSFFAGNGVFIGEGNSPDFLGVTTCLDLEGITLVSIYDYLLVS